MTDGDTEVVVAMIVVTGEEDLIIEEVAVVMIVTVKIGTMAVTEMIVVVVVMRDENVKHLTVTKEEVNLPQVIYIYIL